MKLIDLFTSLPISLQVMLARKYINWQFKKKVKFKVTGKENFSLVKEPAIFICNHMSNIDGVVLTGLLKERFDPYFVAGIKLTNEKFTNFFKNLIKTINIKPNSADLDSMKEIINIIKSGHNLMIFPEGTRSRNKALLEAKKGILFIAKMTKAQIVPISMMGTEEVMPIDKDEDMSRERIHYGEIRIVVGKPFYIEAKAKEESKDEYEERSLNKIMTSIAVNLDEKYRGYYKDKV